MHRQIYREFVHDTAEMIHDINPNCLVAFPWAYRKGMPEQPDPGIAYLTGDIGNGVAGLSEAAHWYDSLGMPFDLMTLVPVLPYRNKPKPREQITQEIAIIIANGGRYSAWDIPTRESRLFPEIAESLGQVVAPFLRERQDYCLGTERVPEVSLLNSAAAHYAATESDERVFVVPDDQIDGACDTLSRLHLNYEMLGDWQLREQQVNSPLLIVEDPAALTTETVDAVIEFVQDGGDVLMTGRGLVHDTRLRQLFGISDIVVPNDAEELVVQLEDTTAQFENHLFRCTLSSAERILDVEDNLGQRHPLLVSNSIGEGNAFYAAIALLSRQKHTVVPESLQRDVLAAVLPSEARVVNTDARETVEVVLRRKDNQYILHLVNRSEGDREMYEGPEGQAPRVTNIPAASACRVSIRVPAKPSIVTLQPQGELLREWVFTNGRLETNVPEFAIHQIVVIQI